MDNTNSENPRLESQSDGVPPRIAIQLFQQSGSPETQSPTVVAGGRIYRDYLKEIFETNLVGEKIHQGPSFQLEIY